MSEPRPEQLADTLWRVLRPHLVELLHTVQAQVRSGDPVTDEDSHIAQRVAAQLARHRHNLSEGKTQGQKRPASRRKAAP